MVERVKKWFAFLNKMMYSHKNEFFFLYTLKCQNPP